MIYLIRRGQTDPETAQGVIYRFLDGRIDRFECGALPSARPAR